MIRFVCVATNAPPALGAVFVVFFAAAPALADGNEVCATAAEQAQSLRKAGKLREARERLVKCTRDTCSAIVRPFCAQWLSEVDAALPSVVIRALDARGQDVLEARVVLDGQPLTERLDGLAVAVDPGAHHVRCEARGGAAAEGDFLIAEGEKNRPLILRFPASLRSDGGPDAAAPLTPDAQRAPRSAGDERSAPWRAWSYVAGGVAALGLGSFLYFDLSSWSDYRHLQDTCGVSRLSSIGPLGDPDEDRCVGRLAGRRHRGTGGRCLADLGSTRSFRKLIAGRNDRVIPPSSGSGAQDWLGSSDFRDLSCSRQPTHVLHYPIDRLRPRWHVAPPSFGDDVSHDRRRTSSRRAPLATTANPRLRPARSGRSPWPPRQA